MKWWLIGALALAGLSGCIEDNDTPVMEPEPGEPEPGEPEPGEPEPGEPEPGEPEPGPVTEPDSPEPDSPEPDSPEPDSPEPDSPEPDSPEPEPMDPCSLMCERVVSCLDERCDFPAFFQTFDSCMGTCANLPDLVETVAGYETCEEVYDRVGQVFIHPQLLGEYCVGTLEPACPACERIQACFAEECSPLPPQEVRVCNTFCENDPGLLDRTLAGQGTCGEVVQAVNETIPDLGAVCDGPPVGGCYRVCDRLLQDCNAPVEQVGDCIRACIEAEPSPEQIQCGLTAACDAVEACAEGPPPEDGCAQVCNRLVQECGAPADQMDECVQACTQANPTPEQIQCGLTAACEAVEACGEMQPPPNDQVAQECAQACEFVIMCQPNLPPDIDPQAECTAACISDSTAAERACVLGLDACEGLMNCFEEDQP